MARSKRSRPSKRARQNRSQLRRSGRLLENLEERRLLATLAGEVFQDDNSDGVRGAEELPAANIRVYLDANNDGQFSDGENFVRTDADGQYVFEDILAGDYVLRTDLLIGQTQTAPFGYYGAAIPPGGAAGQSQLFNLDSMGNVSFFGDQSDTSIDGLVRTNSGTFIGVDETSEEIFLIDPVSGAPTSVGTFTEDLGGGLAYDTATDTTYAVVANGVDAQLHTVDPSTGTISDSGLIPNLRGFSRDGTIYDINPDTGEVNELPGQTVFDKEVVNSVAANSNGNVIGIFTPNIFEFNFQGDSVTSRQIATVDRPVSAIAYDPNDQLFGVSGPQPNSPGTKFFELDPFTGEISNERIISYQGESISVLGFTITEDGTHYIVDATNLYTFDPVTGEATQFPRSLPSFSPNFASITAAPDGFLYATLFDRETTLARVDPATGLGELVEAPSEIFAGLVPIGDHGPRLLGGVNDVADLAFDWTNERIVGYDDVSDRFFQFDTSGRGQLLAQSEIPMNGMSLAFDGERFVMFNADDPDSQETFQVDPDTGAVQAFLSVNQPTLASALDFSPVNTGHSVTVTAVSDVTELDFGVEGDVIVPTIGDGLFINELLVEPIFGNDDTDQLVEIRGPANYRIPDGTYLAVVEEDSFGLRRPVGEVHTVFDLSGQQLGSNGFLVLLQQQSPHGVSSEATVLRSNLEGFGGLPGDIFSDASTRADVIPSRIQANGFLLVQSDVPVVVGQDIDQDDDGRADPDGVSANWTVHDSVSMHPFVGRGDVTYSNIVFTERGVGTIPDYVRNDGVEVVITEGYGYAGRIGDSIGSDPDDWVAGTANDSDAPGPQLGLETGIFGYPIPRPYIGRDLNHFGESNFVGGVRGTVVLSPAAPGDSTLEAAPGVTVLADTNANGRRDVIRFEIDPDSFPDNTEVTNSLDGVTLSTARDDNAHRGFNVEADTEFRTFNKIFTSSGIPWFSESGRFRADFYRPARSVSIDGIGASTFTSTYIVIEAYDADNNLLDRQISTGLASGQRQTVSVGFDSDIISYAVAYSASSIVDDDGTVLNGTPFGKLDRFAYTQSEAIAITDELGFYEITNLFPDDYQITFVNSATNRDLQGAQSIPIQIDKYENFILNPNLIPNTDNLEITLPENAAPFTLLADVPGSDDDGEVTFSIGEGEEFGVVVDAVTGELRLGPFPNLDYEANPVVDVVVNVTDPLGAVVSSLVTIRLQDLNEAPIGQSSTIILPEGTTNGTALGRIQAEDPDIFQNQSLTYEITGGTAAELVSVNDENGIVRLIDEASVDFESMPTLTLDVRVTDSGSPTESITISNVIQVSDANDRPVLFAEDFTVDENDTGVVASVLLTDPDDGQSHTFRIEGGTGQDLFDVNASGEIVVREGRTVDFEENGSYSLQIGVIDNGAPPLGDSQEITITVRDIDEPAMLISNEAFVDEAVEEGTVISTLELIDPEGLEDNYDIALLNPPANFSFDPESFELSVAEGAEFDFESNSIYTLVFEVVNNTGEGESDEPVQYDFLVNVTNSNDAPEVNDQQIRVSEFAEPNTLLGLLEISDPDGVDAFVSSIVGGTGQPFFQINPNTHAISLAPGAELDADGETNALTLDVRVTDSGGLAGTGTVTVRINNVNEAPVFNADTLVVPQAISGQPFELTLPDGFIVDPEGGSVIVSVFDDQGALPDWLEYDSVSRILRGTPNPELIGDQSLTIRAFELGALDLVSTFDLNINVIAGETPLQNKRDARDVNNDNFIRPFDVLSVINFMSRFGAGASATQGDTFFGFIDTNGDGFVTPFDALLVINALTQGITIVQGEGIDDFIDDDDRETAVDAAFGELGSLF